MIREDKRDKDIDKDIDDEGYKNKNKSKTLDFFGKSRIWKKKLTIFRRI